MVSPATATTRLTSGSRQDEPVTVMQIRHHGAPVDGDDAEQERQDEHDGRDGAGDGRDEVEILFRGVRGRLGTGDVDGSVLDLHALPSFFLQESIIRDILPKKRLNIHYK